MRHVTLKTADIHTNSQGEQGGLGASSPSWDTVKAEVSLIMVLLLVLQGCRRKSLLLEGHSVLRRWMLLLRGAASASWITALPRRAAVMEGAALPLGSATGLWPTPQLLLSLRLQAGIG